MKAPATRSIGRKTAASTGRSSPATACPTATWGRTGIAVSADGRRVYATIDCKDHAGLYRSDDGGDTWTLASSDARLTSRAWYFNSIAVDPGNADVLYIPNVALYRTEDGGKTIEIVRGAPGGDDYHQVWVDPKDSEPPRAWRRSGRQRFARPRQNLDHLV